MRKWITLLTLSLFCLIFTSVVPTTPIFAQEPITCPRFIVSRLVVGQTGRVTPGDANNVRAEPSRQATSIGSIPGEGVFTVLDGPICADDFAWWQVDYEGLIGWTVEGADGQYWLEPYTEPCSSPFQIGDEIEITDYSLDLYTVPDERNIESQFVALPEKTVVTVMDEPHCGQFGRSVWLKVEYEGEIGWIEASRYLSSCEMCDQSSWVYSVRRPLLPLLPVSADETARRILALPTPAIDPEKAITVANADQLTQLNRIGEGYITDFDWSPDNAHVAIANSVNVGLYDVHRLNTDPIVLSGFSGTPETVLYSPDGSVLAVSDSAGVITLWDMETYTRLSALEMSTVNWAAGIVFNINGTLLAAATSADGVHVWDVTDATQPNLIYSDSHAAMEVRFVADSDQLISRGDSDFYLHTPADGQPSRNFGGVERKIYGWTVSPDGTRLSALTVESNGDMFAVYATYMTHWEVSGDLPMIYADSISLFEPAPYAQNDLEFRSDGRVLLYNLGETHILEGNPRGETDLNIPDTTDADYAPDDSFIAFGTNSGAIYLVHNREIVDSLFGIEGRVYEVAFSPDSHYVAAHGSDNSMRVWDVSSRQRLGTVQFESLKAQRDLVVNADGSAILIGSELLDTMTGQTLETLEPLAERSHAPIFMRPGGQLVGMRQTDSDDSLRGTLVSDLRTGEVIGNFPPTTIFVAYDVEGRFMAYSALDEINQSNVEVFETQTGMGIRLLERYFEDADNVALNATGDLLVVEDRMLKKLLVWDVRDGALLAEIPNDKDVFRVIFSPDSRKIAWIPSSSQSSSSIYVHDILTENTIQTVALPEVLGSNGIYDLTFSQDSSLVATGYNDGNVYLLDVSGEAGHPLSVLPSRESGSGRLVFSADGERLFSVGEDGVLRVWGLPVK